MFRGETVRTDIHLCILSFLFFRDPSWTWIMFLTYFLIGQYCKLLFYLLLHSFEKKSLFFFQPPNEIRAKVYFHIYVCLCIIQGCLVQVSRPWHYWHLGPGYRLLWGCPVHYWMFSRILGPYPVGSSSIPPTPSRDKKMISRHSIVHHRTKSPLLKTAGLVLSLLLSVSLDLLSGGHCLYSDMYIPI